MELITATGRWLTVCAAASKREIRSKTMLVCYCLSAMLVFGAYIGYDSVGGGRYGAQLIGDLFMAAVTYFGGLVAIFGCATCIRQEMESREAQIILSKPVSRFSYVSGELLGCLTAAYVIIVGMAIASAIVYAVTGSGIPKALLAVAVASCLKISIAGVLALCLSLIVSSNVANMATLFIYVMGHLRSPLEHVASQMDSGRMESVLKLLNTILPNFDRFNLQSNLNFGTPIPLLSQDILDLLKGIQAHQVPLGAASRQILNDIISGSASWGGMITYTVVYIMGILLLASAIMKRKDI